jgi:hypothetical protein
MFQFAFAGLVLYSLISDRQWLADASKAAKWFYYSIHAVAVGLWFAALIGYPVLLPTQYFADKIYPWVRTLFQFGA